MTPYGYGRSSVDDEALTERLGGWQSPAGSGRPILPHVLPAPLPSAAGGTPAQELPNVSRMYDYMTGGSHNFRADRVAVEQLLERFPDAARAAVANRAFVARAVRFLTGLGVRQFIDLGAGIPSACTRRTGTCPGLGGTGVHQVAQAAAPDARVLYVDIDPVAVAHGRSVLAGNDGARMIRADLRRPDHILTHPELLARIDMSRPVAVLMNAVLHFVADRDDPSGLVGTYRDALPPGGFLVISHAMARRGPVENHVVEVFRQTAMPLYPRPATQIERLFAGTELLPPGLVPVTRWWPGEAGPDGAAHGDDVPILGGVARVPDGGPHGLRRTCVARNAFPVLRVEAGPPMNSAGAVLEHRRAGRDDPRAAARSRWDGIRGGQVTRGWAGTR